MIIYLVLAALTVAGIIGLVTFYWERWRKKPINDGR